MDRIDITRPDKLLLMGIKTLGQIGQSLYTNQKAEAKAKAELAFIGEQKLDEVKSQLYTISQDAFHKSVEIQSFDFIKSPETKSNYWLNFHGIHDVDLIQKVGTIVGLDRLVLKKILDTTQRPKVETYDDHLFFSVKSILKKGHNELKIEQLSFVLTKGGIISFQEEAGDHFESIRNKIEEGLGSIRKKKSDFLLAQLLDAVLDNYFETIDQLNFEIGEIEKVVLNRPDKSTLIALESHKQQSQAIKKALRPFKESLVTLANSTGSLIRNENVKFIQDLANLATSATEEIDATLNRLEGLTNIYFASVSQRMNEIMKVLTTVATIFIPLTFIVGIYGMNFENMPELKHPYGYFYTWGAMGITAIGMIIYFIRKKWL